MNDPKKQSVIDRLQKLNNQVQNLTNQEDILLAAIGFTQQCEQESDILQLLKQDEIDDLNLLHQQKQQIIAKYSNFYEEIKSYKKTHNILLSTRPLFEALLHNDPAQRAVTSMDLILALKRELEEGLSIIIGSSANHECFVFKFADVSYKSGIHVSLRDVDHEAWCNNKEAFELKQKTKAWYHYNQLALINRIYNDAQAMHTELMNKGCIFEAANVSAIYNEFVASQNNKNYIFKHIDVNKIQSHVQKVFDYIEVKLTVEFFTSSSVKNKKNLKSQSNTIDATRTFTYKHTTTKGINGFLSDGKITYKPKGHSAILIYRLVKNKNNMPADEVRNFMTSDKPSVQKQQVKNARRTVNNGALKKFKISELIQSDDGYLSIPYQINLIK